VYPALSLLIDGAEIMHTEGGSVPVVNPATGFEIGRLPVATAKELDLAIAAAERGLGVWRAVPAIERARVLRRAAQLIDERIETMAPHLTSENGKPLSEARAELRVAAETFDWFADEARRIYGRVIPPRIPELRLSAERAPVGVVAAFSPWNFPAVTSAKKIAPSLAAGCAMVLKPAEETPATPLAIARCLIDAGLPAGVLNLVYGDPAAISAHLIAAPAVRKVTFTGSTAVGRSLARQAADGLKRLTMELGGHAPVIVCGDVDVHRTAELSSAAKFRAAGQICSAPSRFIVARQAYPSFFEALAAAASKIRVGDGLDPGTQMGPLANERRLRALEALTTDAIGRGARLVFGGRRVGNAGFYFEPTVLADVPPTARIMQEEPFGPVAAVVPFDSLEEALAIANGTALGLAGYVFSQDAATARRIAGELETGLVGINTFAISLAETPFGGVKASGYGLEGGSEGIEAYLVTKFISEAA
jgi:succinate-semialdehyde dehydrogenase/glutarate-semialdehyde dehydrogenase